MIRKELIFNYEKTPVEKIFDLLDQGVPNAEISRQIDSQIVSQRKPENTSQSNPKKKVLHALNDLLPVLSVSKRDVDGFDFTVSTKPLHQESPLQIKVKVQSDNSSLESFVSSYGKTPGEAETNLLRAGIIPINGSQEKSVLRSEILQKVILIRRIKQYGNFLLEINKQKRSQYRKRDYFVGCVSVENVGKAIFQSPLLMGAYITETLGFEDVYKKHDLVAFINAFSTGEPLPIGIQVKSSQTGIEAFINESKDNYCHPNFFYKRRFIILNGQEAEEIILDSFNSQLNKIISYESSKR